MIYLCKFFFQAEDGIRDLTVTGVQFCFSSRRRHTRFDCDWSSDVCSSDLRNHWVGIKLIAKQSNPDGIGAQITWQAGDLKRSIYKTGGGSYLAAHDPRVVLGIGRSEERRVGKECRSRWSPYH